MPHLLTALAAGSGSALLIVLLRRWAPQLGLVDRPGGRKAHEVPVPAVGGLAMFVALLPFVVTNMHKASMGLTLALGLLVAVGIIDDKKSLSARTRLAAEVVAAGILVYYGQNVLYLGNLFGLIPLHVPVVLSGIFTIVCFLGVTNAVNMSDGLDGLAGSIAYVAIAFFTGVALLAGKFAIASMGATVLGLLVGFLAFNLRTPWRRRASVFMGDAGSMVLGFLLAWFAIALAGRESSLLTPIGAVWILAVPLLDMGSVMLYRMRQGASPFRPDRLHLHYILVDRGLAVGRTVSCMTTAAIVCGTIGVTFPLLGIPEWVMFYAFLALWALTYRWLVVSARARRPIPTALLSLSVKPRTALDDAPVGRPP